MSVLTRIKNEGHKHFPYEHSYQTNQHNIKKYGMAIDLCSGFYTEYLDGIPEGKYAGCNGGQILKFIGLYLGTNMRDGVCIGNGRLWADRQESKLIAEYFSGPDNIPIFTFSRNYEGWWTESYWRDAVDNQNIALEVIRDWQLYFQKLAKPNLKIPEPDEIVLPRRN